MISPARISDSINIDQMGLLVIPGGNRIRFLLAEFHTTTSGVTFMQKVAAGPECPECTAEVPFEGGARVNEIIECPECSSELEVTSVQPPELVLAPEVEEDWGE